MLNQELWEHIKQGSLKLKLETLQREIDRQTPV